MENKAAEAWDAASGWLLFAGVVAVLGAVVAAAGWAAGTFETVGIVLGCAVLSTIVAVAARGLLRWGIEDMPAVERVTVDRLRREAHLKRAA